MIVYCIPINRKLYDRRLTDVRSRRIRFCLESDDFTRELVSSIGERGELNKRLKVEGFVDMFDEDTRIAG